APIHRSTEVQEKTQRQLFLSDEQPQHESIQSGVGVPVDQAKVVARRVVAKVGELDRLTASPRAPLAAHLPADRAADLQRQCLEAAQQRRLQQWGQAASPAPVPARYATGAR